MAITWGFSQFRCFLKQLRQLLLTKASDLRDCHQVQSLDQHPLRDLKICHCPALGETLGSALSETLCPALGETYYATFFAALRNALLEVQLFQFLSHLCVLIKFCLNFPEVSDFRFLYKGRIPTSLDLRRTLAEQG